MNFKESESFSKHDELPKRVCNKYWDTLRTINNIYNILQYRKTTDECFGKKKKKKKDKTQKVAGRMKEEWRVELGDGGIYSFSDIR